MDGYFGVPPEHQPLCGGWLDTGDLGFLVEGELFITGRAKDVIVHGGVNVHPHEIESAVERLPGLRLGRVAAFSVSRPELSKEDVVCVAETRAATMTERSALEAIILRRVTEEVNLGLDRVVLVRPGAIPKTTSGKTQRARCREMLLSGELLDSARTEAEEPST
jgi:acyl-CoA synthetase (AMP-forming)/AMP-acid ligase II